MLRFRLEPGDTVFVDARNVDLSCLLTGEFPDQAPKCMVIPVCPPQGVTLAESILRLSREELLALLSMQPELGTS